MSRKGPTNARPARSMVVPSIFTTGDAATPAVQSTVALGIRSPAAMTPCSSTLSTFTPVKISTPSFLSRLAAFFDKDSAKVGRTRAPPSSNRIRLLAGSILRKFPRRVTETNCAIEAASSTPVGPPPTRTNVIWRARSFSSSVDSASSKALRILVRIVSASLRLLRPGANRANSSWPK